MRARHPLRHLGLHPRQTFSQMARYKCPGIILLVVLASAGSAFGVGLNDILDVVRLGRLVVVQAMESWDLVLPQHSGDRIPGEDLVLMKMMERELLKQMDQISRQISEYQERMENKADTILAQLLSQLPKQRRLDNSLRDLDRYVGQVQGLYKLFAIYVNNTDKYEKYTMLEFAKTCVSPRLGELPDVLESMHRLMVPSKEQVYDGSILVLLANQMGVGIWHI